MESPADDARKLDEALNGPIVSGEFSIPASVVWDDLFEAMTVEQFRLTGGSFSGSTFQKCHFHNVHFLNTNLAFVTFKNCTFKEVVIEQCSVEGMKFIDCTAASVQFC